MIPLFAPARQNERLLPHIQDRMLRVLRSGEYVLGPDVDAFEKALAAKLGWSQAIGVASGTEALVLALRALDLEAGAEVITPAFSFVASANAVAWAGLTPVFADVSAETACVTAETVRARLTGRTRAVVAVDLYGRQAPIAELRTLCDRYGLYLISDGAQSIGVPSHGARGAHLYTTSFYPTKNIGAMGDGGAVLTNDPALAAKVREASRHGGLLRDHYVRLGTTGRLDTIQAAALDVKLPYLESWTSRRRTVAAWYYRHLRPLADAKVLTLPSIEGEASHNVWALYTLRIPSGRAALVEKMKLRGVGCGVYYPRSLHRQPALERYATAPCPVSDLLAEEVFQLPLYPELSAVEFETVVTRLSECLGQRKTGSTSSSTNPSSPKTPEPSRGSVRVPEPPST